MIKLPPDWHERALEAVRVRLNHRAGDTPGQPDIKRLRLLELTSDYRIVERSAPLAPYTTQVSPLVEFPPL